MTTYSGPGVFNVLDYLMVAGPSGIGSDNATFLQNAIDAAQASSYESIARQRLAIYASSIQSFVRKSQNASPA